MSLFIIFSGYSLKKLQYKNGIIKDLINLVDKDTQQAGYFHFVVFLK